jgi:hypothetical protein
MLCLTIQIDLSKAKNFDCDGFLFFVRALGRFPEVDKVADKTIAFNFFTEELPSLWKSLWQDLYQSSEYGAILAAASVVACESEQEADTELLLFHFDSSETLDEI